MKCVTSLLGLTILMASVVAAGAMSKRERDACSRAIQHWAEHGFTGREPKCAPMAKPHEYGWTCPNPEAGPERVKGEGTRYKQHAICK
jgi:hypothetical protein